MRKFQILGILFLVFFLSLSGSVAGQSYSFTVPESEAAFSVDESGNVTIEYYYLFVNDPAGPVMEFIDVGMPYPGSYSLSNFSVTINGKKITHIASSTVLSGGLNLDWVQIPSNPAGRRSLHQAGWHHRCPVHHQSGWQ